MKRGTDSASGSKPPTSKTAAAGTKSKSKSAGNKKTTGKEARLFEQRERARQEDLVLAHQKLAEHGLDFKDEELPDDDLEEKDVERTMQHSLLSMIPYTNAWYEAKAAEDEMDDLKKIRIEKVKAADLLIMSKMGRHDEALEQMMEETNYDYFYFNKLRNKMELDGKYKYDEPREDRTFSDLRRGQKRNRIRNAVNAVYDSIDEETLAELARLTSVGDVGGGKNKTSKIYDKNSACSWRGKSKDGGEALRCENKRMLKPIPPDASPRSRQKMKESEDVLACCSYHNAFCISVSHVPFGSVRIRVPNPESLCAECFMVQRGKKLPALKPETCPGVVPSRIAAMSQSGKLKSDAELEEEASINSTSLNSIDSLTGKKKQKTELCEWVADPNSEQQRAYECGNFKFVHPESGVKLSCCAWHQKNCVRQHPPASNSSIQQPNQYGLCAMHYLAHTASPVPSIPIPYPGMRLKQGKDFWKRRGRHFATPKVEPPRILTAADFHHPNRPIGILGEIVHAYHMFLHRRQVKRLGDHMAVRIQALFRGKRVRGTHINLKFIKLRRARLISAVKVQSAMRRFLRAKFTRELRILYNKSALRIQKVYRGHWCRVQLYIDWAAKRLAKFMRTLHFFKFKDTVIMVMQLRRMWKKRMLLALLIQRVYRGYSTRCFLFNRRLITIIMRSYARKIQRAFRCYIERKNLVPWQPPGEDWVHAQCAKRLSLLLLQLLKQRQQRRLLAIQQRSAAPTLQRIVRGFLRRAGAKKMRNLRLAVRNWLNPQQATDFLKEYLESKIFYLRELRNRQHTPKRDVKSDIRIVRCFLPPDKQNFFEVDFRVFDPALEAYYESVRMPLVKSERDSLFKKFKNPMNGNVNVRALDAFIYSHKLPCRKHGRHLCGDCVYRKSCNIHNCKCYEFKSTSRDGIGICANCNHPGTLHTLCPLQMKYSQHEDAIATTVSGVGTSSLLKIMTAVREPDMSLPMGVEGVLVDDVIIRPATPSDLREQRTKEVQLEMSLLQTGQLERMNNRTLAKSLALCEIDGDTVFDNNAYWDQYGTSVVRPIEDAAKAAAAAAAQGTKGYRKGLAPSTGDRGTCDTAIFDPVTFDSRAPDYDIPQNVFWSLTGKNPNKRVRDYHEKFDHNMPVPVVHNNEIVYSFEGSQIYFNLVNMIIRMEKQVHFDNPKFLKLVVDHIQIFERHWRKMVVDIRKGKLDRNLNVSKESRFVFQSANLPRPKLATQLDNTFRALGFHKKVLGKDIQIRGYAELKSPFEASMESLLQSPTTLRTPSQQQQQRRKYSLPSSSSSRPLTAKSDIATSVAATAAKTPPANTAASVLSTSSALCPLDTASTRRSPHHRSNSFIDQSFDSAAEDISTGNKVSSRMTMSSRAGESRKSSRRDLLVALGNSFKANNDSTAPAAAVATEGSSRGGSRSDQRRGANSSSAANSSVERKRRGSHSDAQRPATAEEVDKAHYELKAAPRDIYSHALQMDGDRFVCPFPACGRSFHSKDAAFRHLPVHEQRTRLYAPTPLPDSHLMFYWPQSVPWHGAIKYSERQIPPGSLPCTAPGCTAVFSTRARLDNHLKLTHMKMDPSNASLGYFQLQGSSVMLPPGPLPDYLRCTLRWCALHALPMGNCSVCVEIEALPQTPKPPFKLHEAVRVDVREKRAKLLRMLGTGAKAAAVMSAGQVLTRENAEFVLRCNEAEVGVIVLSEVAAAGKKATTHRRVLNGQQQQLLSQTNSPLGSNNTNSDNKAATANTTASAAAVDSSSGGMKEIKEWRGRPVAVLLDRLDKCWVAVEVLLSHSEATKRRLLLPADFHKRFELHRPLAAFANNKLRSVADDEDSGNDSDNSSNSNSNSLRDSDSRDSFRSPTAAAVDDDAGSRCSSSRRKQRKKLQPRKHAKKLSQHEKDFNRLPAGSVLRLQQTAATIAAAEEAMSKFIRWVPLSQIDRSFKLVFCTREEIALAVDANSSVTLRNTHFVSID